MFYLIQNRTVLAESDNRTEIENSAKYEAKEEELHTALAFLQAVISVDVDTYDRQMAQADAGMEMLEESQTRLQRKISHEREERLRIERDQDEREWNRQRALRDLEEAKRHGNELELNRAVQRLKEIGQ